MSGALWDSVVRGGGFGFAAGGGAFGCGGRAGCGGGFGGASDFHDTAKSSVPCPLLCLGPQLMW